MPWALPLLAPELLAALAVGFEVIAAAVVLLVLAMTVKTWLEPQISSTSTHQGGRILRILDIPGKAIRGVAASAFNAVSHRLSVAATHQMHPLARWLHALGSLAIGSAWAVGHFAADTAYAVERLATVVLPREIHEVTRPIGRKASKALAGALAAGLAARHLRHYVNRLWTHEIRPGLHRLEHAVDVTLPRKLGRIGVRVRDLERDFTHPSTRWLRRTALAMWAATLAGLMVRTLARRFPWLFCRQVKKVGGRLCGLDPSLLDSLLLDALVLTSGISVVTFAKELQALEHEALVLVAAGIDELKPPRD